MPSPSPTRAASAVIDPSGAIGPTGFGHVAGRSARHAELVALFDALLQDAAAHERIAATVVAPLVALAAAATAARAARVAASKVDFFTMVRGE